MGGLGGSGSFTHQRGRKAQNLERPLNIKRESHFFSKTYAYFEGTISKLKANALSISQSRLPPRKVSDLPTIALKATGPVNGFRFGFRTWGLAIQSSQGMAKKYPT